MEGPADLACNEIVELVTDYLEGALDDATRTRLELHVITCRGCETYLDQMRDAAMIVRGTAQDPDPAQLEALVDAFRGWHRRTSEER